MTPARRAAADVDERSSRESGPAGGRGAGRDRWFPVWMLTLLLGLFAPRVYLIIQARTALIDSDEAITGLMARHILQGHIPIWLYGITYQGSLEAFSAAALFSVFGATPLMLKVEAICWFCGFVWSHYLFAREITDRVTARWSTLAVAASPAFLTIWSVSVVGTYMSTLCLGTVALLLAARMLRRGVSAGRLGLLGAVMGLGWWTFPLAILYIGPILFVLVVGARRQLVSRMALALPAGFILGSLPFWPYNLTHRFASLFVRSQIPHAEATVRTAVSGLVRRATPILLGARPSHGTGDFFGWASVLTVAVVAVAGFLALRRYLRERRLPRWTVDGRDLAFAMTGWALLVYVLSGWGYNAEEPRYLIPLYSVLYILLLFGLRTRYQAVLASLLIAMNVVGTVSPSVSLATPLNPEPTGELVAFLRAHNVRTAYAPYWTAYRLAFESGETIIVSPPPKDLVRYSPYLDAVRADPAPAYVQLDRSRYKDSQNPLHPPSGYVMTRVGNFEVFLPDRTLRSGSRPTGVGIDATARP
jgi:hypothetical protein